MTVFCGKRGDQVICFHISNRKRFSVPSDHSVRSRTLPRLNRLHPYEPGCKLMELRGEVSSAVSHGLLTNLRLKLMKLRIKTTFLGKIYRRRDLKTQTFICFRQHTFSPWKETNEKKKRRKNEKRQRTKEKKKETRSRFLLFSWSYFCVAIFVCMVPWPSSLRQVGDLFRLSLNQVTKHCR